MKINNLPTDENVKATSRISGIRLDKNTAAGTADARGDRVTVSSEAIRLASGDKSGAAEATTNEADEMQARLLGLRSLVRAGRLPIDVNALSHAIMQDESE